MDRVVSSCRGGEHQFLLPDTHIPRHRYLGSCLDIDRCSLVIGRSAGAHGNTRLVTDATGKVVEDMNYGAFGNALGFNAATALTTYLYSSMPFDAASGNYYDHARYFNTGTGSFTQADYGYTGSLANPMTDLPYAFTGGDPIDMLDSSGHFSLGGLSISVSIMAGLNGILGATLGARNGIWGAVGGLVGGIDSTYISIYGSFLPGGPFVGFGAGAAVGAASELVV